MTPMRMPIDPLLPWDGQFPYLVLQPFGITPDSTSTEILDLSYVLTPEQNNDPIINRAWDALRITKTRLVADFFCLDLPDAAADGIHPADWNEACALLLSKLQPLLPDLPVPEFEPLLPDSLPALHGGDVSPPASEDDRP